MESLTRDHFLESKPISGFSRSNSYQIPKILIVDDEASDRQRMSIVCSKLGDLPVVIQASTLEEAKEILHRERFHVLVLDRQLKIAHGDDFENGIDQVPTFLEIQPHLQILVVTGTKEISEVVRAINLGASNYLVKDTPDDLIRAQIERAICQAQIKLREIQFLRTNEKQEIDFVGNSSAIRNFKNRLKGISESDRPVLLLGESGTGKTTAARFIHNLRCKLHGIKEASFYSLNMGAIPSTLAERELFGNERGAFTDAKELRQGIFELADGGTLFLDEIGEAPLDLQAKLLKVLEEGRFRRLGGQQEKKSNFKLICATNKNLEQLVKDGLFREDLYMRISTFVVNVPNLQDREDDVDEIIRQILPKSCAENKISIKYSDLPSELTRFLKDNPVPGNIRGIEHLLSRLLVLSPKGKNGQPDFSNWRTLLFPRVRATANYVKSEIRIPFDSNDKNFKGLESLKTNLENEVIKLMSDRLHRTEDIAASLKISNATVHRLLKRIGQSNRRKLKDRILKSKRSAHDNQ